MSLLSFKNVSKSFPDGPRPIPVLTEVSFEIHPGESSGFGVGRSGKSTVLRLAAGVELPDAGKIIFDGEDIARNVAGRAGEAASAWWIALALADWSPTVRRPVVEHVALPLVGCGLSFHDAEAAARRRSGESAPRRFRTG